MRIRSLADLDVMAVAVDDAVRRQFSRPDADVSATIADAYYALFLPDMGHWTPRRFGRRLRSVAPDVLRQGLYESIELFFRYPGPAPRRTSQRQRKVTSEILWQDVYRLAGEACIDPGPRTYGELAAIAEGRRKLEWAQTACIRADLLNSNPFRKGGGSAKPEDLDPTGGLKDGGGAKQSMEITPDAIGVLGRVFGR